jgi:hypothetical protein
VSRHRRAACGRAQTSLLALVVALLTVAAATGVGLALADGALAGADRDPLERRAAGALADRLVAGGAPTTERPNVLNRSRVRNLTADDVDRLVAAVRGRPVRLRLGDRTLLSRGDPGAGATTRRLVLVAERTTTTRRLDLDRTDSLTLPRRTPRVRLRVDSGPDTTVRTVRANGRVVLHDPDGLDGTATVSLPRSETTRLSVATRGGTNGSVRITSYPAETTKATLVVTVGA